MLVILPVTFCLLILSIFSVSDATDCSNSSTCNPKKRPLEKYSRDSSVVETDGGPDTKKKKPNFVPNECLSLNSNNLKNNFTAQDSLSFLDFLKDTSIPNIFSCSKYYVSKFQTSFQNDITALQKAISNFPGIMNRYRLIPFMSLEITHQQIAEWFKDESNRILKDYRLYVWNRLQNVISIIEIMKDILSHECQISNATNDASALLVIVERFSKSLSKFSKAFGNIPAINPHSDTLNNHKEGILNQQLESEPIDSHDNLDESRRVMKRKHNSTKMEKDRKDLYPPSDLFPYSHNCPTSSTKRILSINGLNPMKEYLYYVTDSFRIRSLLTVYLYQLTNSFVDVIFARFLGLLLRLHTYELKNWTIDLLEYGNLILDSINALKKEHLPIIYTLSGNSRKTNSNLPNTSHLFSLRKPFSFLSLFSYADKIKGVDLTSLQPYIQDSLNSLLELLHEKDLPTDWNLLFKNKFNLTLAVESQRNSGNVVDFTILNLIYEKKKEKNENHFFDDLWRLFTGETESNSEPLQNSVDSNIQCILSVPKPISIDVIGDNPIRKALTKLFQHQIIVTIDRVLRDRLDAVAELNALFADFDELTYASKMTSFNQKYFDKYKLILERLAGITAKDRTDAFNCCIQSLWKVYNFQYNNYINKHRDNFAYLNIIEVLRNQCNPTLLFSEFNDLHLETFDSFPEAPLEYANGNSQPNTESFNAVADNNICNSSANSNELSLPNIANGKQSIDSVTSKYIRILNFFNKTYETLQKITVTSKSMKLSDIKRVQNQISVLISDFTEIPRDYSEISRYFFESFLPAMSISKSKHQTFVLSTKNSSISAEYMRLNQNAIDFFNYLLDYLILTDII